MEQETNPSSTPGGRRLQVLITSGAEDPHRARQGLDVALAAAAMGAEVTVFLTVRGAFWAERRQHASCVVPGCDSIPALIHELLEMDVTIECCSSCARQFTGSCSADGVDLIEGIVLSGLASMLQRTLTGAPTLSF